MNGQIAENVVIKAFVMNGVIKMEMTIEEHIVQLKKLKSFHNGSYGANINFAIATMRKYQKIAEIVQSCGADYNSMDSYDCVEEIARILVHGNDN